MVWPWTGVVEIERKDGLEKQCRGQVKGLTEDQVLQLRMNEQEDP